MNDIERAIQFIKAEEDKSYGLCDCCMNIDGYEEKEIEEMKNTILQALEKQIPKKAVISIPHRAQKCNCCNNDLEPFWDYCPWCGQAFENAI